jgi:uncharacterized protein YecE (DUF72 family)
VAGDSGEIGGMRWYSTTRSWKMVTMDTTSDDIPPQASRLAAKLRALAERGTYFGTGSWIYDGWLGSIYNERRYLTRNKLSKAKFEQACLEEYAETFPTVCGDLTFYQFPSDQYWAKLFNATPKHFIFGFKVPADITVETWPKHARYGKRAGLPNEHFLNAQALEQFFTSWLKRYGKQVGPLIFEFGTFNKKTFPTPADFLAKLDPFLKSLPEGFRYAIEIRNEDYLTPEYLDVLASHNVAHALNAWTRMPTLDHQAQLPGVLTADFTVVRALLRKWRPYDKAVETFEPYDRIQEVNEGAREGLRVIAQRAMQERKDAFLFVNNRLEGNAPSTIEAFGESRRWRNPWTPVLDGGKTIPVTISRCLSQRRPDQLATSQTIVQTTIRQSCLRRQIALLHSPI